MTLLEETRYLLGGTSAIFWTNEHVCDAINEAQYEVFAEAKPYHVISTLTLTANDDLVSIPSTVMIPQYVVGTYGKYFPTTQMKLEQYSREWKAATPAYPKFFVLWDIDTFRVWPRSDDTYLFEVGGVPWPTTEVTTATTDITAPTEIKTILAHRAAASVLEFTQPMLADALNKEAKDLMNRYKIGLRNRQSHNILRLRPGTIFTRAIGGSIEIGKKYS